MRESPDQLLGQLIREGGWEFSAHSTYSFLSPFSPQDYLECLTYWYVSFIKCVDVSIQAIVKKLKFLHGSAARYIYPAVIQCKD